MTTDNNGPVRGHGAEVEDDSELLHPAPSNYSSDVPGTLPLSSERSRPTADRMLERFLGSTTHHGTYDNNAARAGADGKVEIKNTARTLREPASADLWQRHLAGERRLGVTPQRDDDMCRWGAIDIDDRSLSHQDVLDRIVRAKLPLVAVRSKSGGLHLMLFVRDWAPITDAKAALGAMRAQLGLAPETEIFPKGEASNGSGWLNMPYFGGTSSDQYALNPAGGLAMSVESFLNAAERAAVGPDDLRQLGVRRIAGAKVETDPATKLAALCGKVRSAAAGDANNTLTRVAYDVGRHVRDRGMDADEARKAIFAAWAERKAGTPFEVEREFESIWSRQVEKGRSEGRPVSDRATAELTVRSLASVEPQPVNWLWPDRIALGKVSLLAGEPGLGKSQITMAIAAAVTTGGRWPGNEGMAPKGRVILLSAEDDLADTVRPRFDVAGGDPSMLDAVEATVREGERMRGLDLGADLDMLDELLASTPDVRLVIIDPISAYLGRIDSHRNTDVRAIFSPMQAMAERHGVAILFVSHITKAPQRAINSVSGSGAFVAAARAALLVCKEMDQEEGDDGLRWVETGRRLLVTAKNNLGPDGADRSIAYTIEMRGRGEGYIPAPRAVWGEMVRITADEALKRAAGGERQANGKGSGTKERPIEKATLLLADKLKDGPIPSADLKRLADEAGIKEGTLKNAREQLGVKTEKRGDAWYVYLPGRQEEIPF